MQQNATKCNIFGIFLDVALRFPWSGKFIFTAEDAEGRGGIREHAVSGASSVLDEGQKRQHKNFIPQFLCVPPRRVR